AVVGLAPLPVADPLREQHRPVHECDRQHRVEHGLPRRGDVPEDLAGDLGVVVELQGRGDDARCGGDEREKDADTDGELMRLDPARAHAAETYLAVTPQPKFWL